MLKTEMRNPNTKNIDKMSTAEMMRVIQDENLNAVNAIESELDAIGKAVDLISERMAKGGRLFYIGCGTSGRLGVVDASECPPTFGVDYELVRGIIAGGESAMFRAVEGAEDSEEWGARSIDDGGVVKGDVVVGLSASGRAPFVLGALKRAREIGCATIGVSCNPGCILEELCDVSVSPYVGPEVISGST